MGHTVGFEEVVESSYGIVIAEDTLQLVSIVNEQQKAGWKPLGGPFQRMYDVQTIPCICQAMVRDPKYHLELVIDGHRLGFLNPKQGEPSE